MKTTIKDIKDIIIELSIEVSDTKDKAIKANLLRTKFKALELLTKLETLYK